VLRLGGVTAEDLRRLLGTELPIGGSTRAPGTLASHYAPEARVEIVEAAGLVERALRLVDAGERAGVIASAEQLVDRPAGTVTLATPRDAEQYARDLYAALREADVLGLDVVLAVPPPATGIGRAVADRLRRASTPH
jgi:L-threonylcarbamoyladenylate synthase